MARVKELNLGFAGASLRLNQSRRAPRHYTSTYTYTESYIITRVVGNVDIEEENEALICCRCSHKFAQSPEVERLGLDPQICGEQMASYSPRPGTGGETGDDSGMEVLERGRH